MDVNGIRETCEESCNESDENSIDIYSDLDENCELNDFNEDAPTNVKETFSVVQNLIQSFNEDLHSDLQNEQNHVKDSSDMCLKSAEPQNVSEDSSVKEQTICAEMDLFSELLTTEVREKQEKAEKAKIEYKNLLIENTELKKSNADMILENVELKKQNAILKKNICALFKTAKEEMSRKDAMIADLRDQIDGIIFRRSRLLAAANKEPNKVTERLSSDSKENISVEKLKPRQYSDPSYSRKESKEKCQQLTKNATDLTNSYKHWKKYDKHHRIRTFEECLDHQQSARHENEYRKILKKKKKFSDEANLPSEESTCKDIDQERKKWELIKGKEQSIKDILSKSHTSSLNETSKYKTLDEERDQKELFRDSIQKVRIDSDYEKMSLSDNDCNERKHRYENHSNLLANHKRRHKYKSASKNSSKHRKKKKSKDVPSEDELHLIYTDYSKKFSNVHREDTEIRYSDEDKNKELKKGVPFLSDERKKSEMKAITATSSLTSNLISDEECEKDCIPEYKKKNTEVIKILRRAFDKERERLHSDYHPTKFFHNDEILDSGTYNEEYHHIPSDCYINKAGYNFENDYMWYNDCERISSEEDYSYETCVKEEDHDKKYSSKKNKKRDEVLNENIVGKKTFKNSHKENSKDYLDKAHSFDKSQEFQKKINRDKTKNIEKQTVSFKTDSKSITAVGEVPELLKEDTLKLFGYLGKTVPLVIQKKVMGCVKNQQEKVLMS